MHIVQDYQTRDHEMGTRAGSSQVVDTIDIVVVDLSEVPFYFPKAKNH